MENKQKKELIMDEIVIQELQEISGGNILTIVPPRLGGIAKIPTKPPIITFPPLSGIVKRV